MQWRLKQVDNLGLAMHVAIVSCPSPALPAHTASIEKNIQEIYEI